LATAGVAWELAEILKVGELMEVTTGDELWEAAPGASLAVMGQELSDGSSLEAVRRLRKGSAGAGLPVFVVTERYSDAAEVAALEVGVDEFIDATQVGPRLLRRLRARLRQAAERREENPLTGLPGRGRLDRELAGSLSRGEQVALVALDVQHFKAFNDRYGYERGDSLLLLVRDALIGAVRQAGEPADLALHLGGDDFFLLTHPSRAEKLCQLVRERFDQSAPGLYDEADQRAGGLTVRSREGTPVFVPLACLTTVAVSSETKGWGQAGRVAQVLAGLKEFARESENEKLIWDGRRDSHPGTGGPADPGRERNEYGRDYSAGG
jgi:diguanylate cyclase (GGDEF)-like protein